MSYIPASKMPHPHAAPERDPVVAPVPAERPMFRVPPLAWAGAAAVAGVGALAALLSLRSSTPKRRGKARRKPARA